MGRKRETGDTATDARADKTCASCGRRIEWRAAWARDWEAVRYCSDACRARKVRPVDRALEESIRSLLAQRAHDATICPSEAARAVAATDGEAGSTPTTPGARSWSPRAAPPAASSPRGRSRSRRAAGSSTRRRRKVRSGCAAPR